MLCDQQVCLSWSSKKSKHLRLQQDNWGFPGAEAQSSNIIGQRLRLHGGGLRETLPAAQILSSQLFLDLSELEEQLGRATPSPEGQPGWEGGRKVLFVSWSSTVPATIRRSLPRLRRPPAAMEGCGKTAATLTRQWSHKRRFGYCAGTPRAKCF